MNIISNLLHTIISKKRLILKKQSLLIGISGGQDSFFLLILFFILKKQYQFQLYCIYCNHLWQLDSFLSGFQLLKTHYSLIIEIKISMPFSPLKTEADSRNWRYFEFYRITEFYQLDLILTGHTKSDKNETFLFNMFRGGGVSNVSPICWKRIMRIKKFGCFPIKLQGTLRIYSTNSQRKLVLLIRPILFLYRHEIFFFIKRYKCPIIMDKTNFQLKYFRNRIRYQLFPLLRFYFNPKIDETFTRFIEILLPEMEYLNFLTIKLYDQIKIKKVKKSSFSLNLRLFLFLPYNLKKRLLLMILKSLRIPNIQFVLIETLLKLIILNSIQKKKQETKVFLLKKNFLVIFYKNICLIQMIHI